MCQIFALVFEGEEDIYVKTWFKVSVDAGRFWLGFGAYIFIFKYLVVFDTHGLIFVVFLDFEGIRNFLSFKS